MSSQTTPSLKNILLIGETGVGKSSIINLICERDVAKASNSAAGCTLEITKYPYKSFCLIDTVGYNDVSEANGVDRDEKSLLPKMTQSLSNLIKFAKNTNDEGISLIIYVMKRGRVNAASKINYDFFVKKFCQNNVPVLLLVTHCESDSSGSGWHAEANREFIKLEMNFSYTIFGCAMNFPNPFVDEDLAPIYRKKAAKTREQVLDQIQKLSLVEPWKPSNWEEWMKAILAGSVVLGISAAAIAGGGPALLTVVGTAVVSLFSQPGSQRR